MTEESENDRGVNMKWAEFLFKISILSVSRLNDRKNVTSNLKHKLTMD